MTDEEQEHAREIDGGNKRDLNFKAEFKRS